ncbi:MAG: NAD-binding protein [Bacteroidales bacterium]
MNIQKLKAEGLKSVKLAVILLVTIVIIGIIGYILIEQYDFIDAFFMTIITMSTVGFQEVQPLSTAGRIFTAFLIVISFGIFAYAVTTLTRYIVDGIFRHYFMDTKIRNRIQKLTNHIIVCGYGRNGRQSAEELIKHKVEVVIVDKDETIIDEIRAKPNFLYIHGDATNDDTLENANIKTAKALITALPNDANNLFVVLTAREHNPGLSIITRASDANSVKKLKSAGATNVIMPDRIGGQRMAKLVTQPDVIEFLDYIILPTPDEVYIEEISCQQMISDLADKSIGEWAIRQETGANIIGLKTKDNNFIVNPTPDIKISSYDQLFVLGTNEQIEMLKQKLTGK